MIFGDAELSRTRPATIWNVAKHFRPEMTEDKKDRGFLCEDPNNDQLTIWRKERGNELYRINPNVTLSLRVLLFGVPPTLIGFKTHLTRLL